MEPTETRQLLLGAALELFGERGYESTTINDIVERAGVSKGAFYHYFEHKDGVLFLIHDEFIDHVLAEAAAVLDHRSSPPDERLVRLIAGLVESIASYRHHVTVFFQEQRVFSDGKRELIAEKEERYVAGLREVIRDGIEQSVFRADLDVTVVTFGILGMANWTYKWLQPSGRLTPLEVGQMLAELVVRGITVCRDDETRDCGVLAR